MVDKPIAIVFESGKVPKEWQTRVVVSLFKKGDQRVCVNYNEPGEVYSKVLERRVQPRTWNHDPDHHWEIQSLFSQSESCVCVLCSKSVLFPKGVGFHQGCTCHQSCL